MLRRVLLFGAVEAGLLPGLFNYWLHCRICGLFSCHDGSTLRVGVMRC